MGIFGSDKEADLLCINLFLSETWHMGCICSAGVIMNADTSAVLTNTDVYTKAPVL